METILLLAKNLISRFFKIKSIFYYIFASISFITSDIKTIFHKN